MRKFILFLSVVFLLCCANIFAQVSDYVFSNFPGTYTEVAGDTVARATHTSIDPFQLNDVTYGPLALPFNFVFNCLDYNSYFINSNGFITFGPTAPALANYGPITSSETYEGAVSGFGLDLIGVFGTTVNTTTSSNVLTGVTNFKGVVAGRMITAATAIPANTFITSYNQVLGTITMSAAATGAPLSGLVVQIAAGSIIRSTEGVSPNRIHTIQWKNFRQYIIIGTDDNFNFQIKLYEATAQIRVIFGNMDKNSAPVASVFGQLGLRGFNNTDFNDRTNSVTLNWATSTPGLTNAATMMLSGTVFPPSGFQYIWTPTCPLPIEMSSFNSIINRRDVTLKWTTTSEINNMRFEIERSIVNGEWSDVGSVQGNGTTLSSMNYIFTDRNLNTGSYNYRLKQIDLNGNFQYFNLHNEVNIGVPTIFDLSQNYPNPFNPSTKINYDLPFDGRVSLKIFDMSGKEVSTIVNELQTAGYYTVSFNSGNLSSGIYFYTLSSGATVITKKMVLMK